MMDLGTGPGLVEYSSHSGSRIQMVGWMDGWYSMVDWYVGEHVGSTRAQKLLVPPWRFSDVWQVGDGRIQ